MEIESIKKHIRDREYMSGIERDKTRIKATGEIFTREWLSRESLDKIEQFDPTAFSDPTKTFCDPAAGDGNLISEALIRKLEAVAVNGEVTVKQFEQTLRTIYGVDLMQDNVDLCRDRLLCGQEHLRHIVEQNIVCADALRYHYRFDGTDPYKTAQDLQLESLFTFS
jgi:hypothetical protein